MTELNNLVAVIDEGAVTVPSPILHDGRVLIDRGCDPNQDDHQRRGLRGRAGAGRERQGRALQRPGTRRTVAGGSFRVVGPYPACTDTIRVDGGSGTHFPDFTPVVGMFLNVNGVFYFTDDRDRASLPRARVRHQVLGIVDVPPSGAAGSCRSAWSRTRARPTASPSRCRAGTRSSWACTTCWAAAWRCWPRASSRRASTPGTGTGAPRTARASRRAFTSTG